jgi:hypothetical protein
VKRREFIIGGASAGLSATASAGTPAPRFEPEVMEAALGRIDQRMAWLAANELFPAAAAAGGPREELRAARERAIRSAARTLYFIGAFMELEEHQRFHPGVQLRMQRLRPEIAEAVDGMATILESLTPEEHRAIQEAFRDDPEIAERVGEELQSVAKEDGFGFTRRVDLRLAVADFASRMRVQHPALVLDPPVQKLRRLQEHLGTEAEEERRQAIRLGEKAYWELQGRARDAIAQWDVAYTGRPRLYLAALEGTYPANSEPTAGEHADGVIRGSLIAMGIGAGIGLLGLIFYLASGGTGFFGGAAVVLGITIGPLILLGGLIALIVGAIMKANAD